MTRAAPTCTVRPATSADFDDIAQLLYRVFNVWKSPQSLERKFTDSTGKMIGVCVLTHDNRVVGFLGHIPVRIRVQGQDVLAVEGADMAILEEHRRLDSFLAMIQEAARALNAAGCALSYGIANGDAALAMTALLGQNPIASEPLMIRPLRGGISARILALRASVMEALTHGWAGALPDGLRLGVANDFGPRFDRLWQRIRDDYPVWAVRDAAQLERRYGEPNQHQIFCVEHTGTESIEGYAVLRVTNRGNKRRGRICDLVTPRQSDGRVAGELIRAAVRWLREQRADIVDVWMFPHTHLRATLRQHGFIPRCKGRGGIGVSLFAEDAGLNIAEDAESWFLSLGDSDTA